MSRPKHQAPSTKARIRSLWLVVRSTLVYLLPGSAATVEDPGRDHKGRATKKWVLVCRSGQVKSSQVRSDPVQSNPAQSQSQSDRVAGTAVHNKQEYIINKKQTKRRMATQVGDVSGTKAIILQPHPITPEPGLFVVRFYSLEQSSPTTTLKTIIRLSPQQRAAGSLTCTWKGDLTRPERVLGKGKRGGTLEERMGRPGLRNPAGGPSLLGRCCGLTR